MIRQVRMKYLRQKTIRKQLSLLLAGILLLSGTPTVSSSLVAKYWNNTAFSPLSNATITDTLDNLNLTNFATPYSSWRFLGQLTFPTTDLINFNIVTDGEVRLWINDHLVIDGVQTSSSSAAAASRTVPSFLDIPFVTGIPQDFRLEYSNYLSSSASSSSSVLILQYTGNYTSSPTILPSSYYNAIINQGWSNREQLLDRFIGGGSYNNNNNKLSSLNSWQTFHNANMGSHVLFPVGLEVSLTLGYIDGTEEQTLGNIQIFPQFNPAIVVPGLKSINGSDYSSLLIKQWNKLSCDVWLQSTTVVVNNTHGYEEENLQILAIANGTDCRDMVLVVEGIMYPSRTGFISMNADNQGFMGTFPGFDYTVTVTKTNDSPSSVPFSKVSTKNYLALPLGNTSSNENIPFTVGLSSSLSVYPPTNITNSIIKNNLVLAQQRTTDMYSSLFGNTLAPGNNFDNNPYTSVSSSSSSTVPSSNLTLTEIWLPIATIIAWNTIYTPYEGIITPVTRAWDGGSGYVLYEWDNLFLALMASTPAAVRSKKDKDTSFNDNVPFSVSVMADIFLDIAYSNLMQILLARTIEGFVPNYASGSHISFDRTEPPVGAQITLQIYQIDPTKGLSIVNTVIDTLLSWNVWLWEHRTGNEGVYDNLLLLGSDPNVPCSACIGNNTFAGARYESGLDNSAQYEFYNGSGVGFDPVTTHHMFMYDVAFTALYIAETNALITLLEMIGGYDEYIPTLQAQATAVNISLNKYLWNDNDGSYSNAFLYNGTFHPRYAPTVFYPLLSLSANATQANRMMNLLRSPSGFCVDRSYNPGIDFPTNNDYFQLVIDFWNNKNDNAACVSDACTQDILHTTDYIFVRAEAGVLQAQLGTSIFTQNASSLVPLYHYYSSTYDDHTLTTNASLPDASYVSVGGIEGYCFNGEPPSSSLPWATTNLSLWYSSSRHDYQTCGSPQCLSDVKVLGYTLVNLSMCTAWNVTGSENLPCIYGNPSIQRTDPSYYDNTYWRGRNWGPHTYLVYQGLANYDYIPIVNTTKQDLIGMGNEVFLKNYKLYGHVCENVNGIFGLASDKPDASPYYTWGALFGYVSILDYLNH